MQIVFGYAFTFWPVRQNWYAGTVRRVHGYCAWGTWVRYVGSRGTTFEYGMKGTRMRYARWIGTCPGMEFKV